MAGRLMTFAVPVPSPSLRSDRVPPPPMLMVAEGLNPVKSRVRLPRPVLVKEVTLERLPAVLAPPNTTLRLGLGMLKVTDPVPGRVKTPLNVRIEAVVPVESNVV